MTTHTKPDQTIRKLAKLIGEIRIAMLTTETENGALRSRPILTQKTHFDGDLWFITRLDSAKVQEIRQHRQVNLSYVRLHDNTYVSVSGTAELVNDRKKAEELWDPSYQNWLPQGLEDPNLALIRIRVERAEYWDAPALSWPFSAGFVVMSPDVEEHPETHAKIVFKGSEG